MNGRTNSLLMAVFAMTSLLIMACGDETAAPAGGGGLPLEEQELCQQAAADVAQVTARGQMMCCTAVLRLTYEGMEPIGWDVVCADAALVTETQARSAAEEATGFGATGRRITATPRGELDAFLEESETGAEGIAVVSTANGEVLFGGPIGASPAPVPAPAQWRDADVLGNVCDAAFEYDALTQDVEGYDLTDGASPLSQDEIDAVLQATYDTALTAGVLAGTGAFLLDGLVLLYPGSDDIAEAEWVVFVDSGYETCMNFDAVE